MVRDLIEQTLTRTRRSPVTRTNRLWHTHAQMTDGTTNMMDGDTFEGESPIGRRGGGTKGSKAGGGQRVAFCVSVLAWTCAIVEGQLANSAWPMRGGGARRTGLSPFVGAQASVLLWRYTIGSYVFSSPAIGVDGTVYFFGARRALYALNGTTGALKWSYTTRSDVGSSPAIGVDGTVYFGAGALYALNGTTGALKWNYTADDYFASSPAIGVDGTVYFGAEALYALNGTTGALKWNYTAGSFNSDSSPAIGADGTLYFFGAGALYALNGTTGALKWNYTAGSGFYDYSSPAIGADGTVYLGAGALYALNGTTGALKWNYTAGDYFDSSPTIGADGTVYVGSEDNVLYSLNGTTGSVKWSYKTAGPVRAAPVIDTHGTIHVGSCDGIVYAFGGSSSSSTSTTHNVFYLVTGDPSSPSNNGTVYPINVFFSLFVDREHVSFASMDGANAYNGFFILKGQAGARFSSALNWLAFYYAEKVLEDFVYASRTYPNRSTVVSNVGPLRSFVLSNDPLVGIFHDSRPDDAPPIISMYSSFPYTPTEAKLFVGASSLASKTGTPTSAGTRTASASAFETGTATSTSTRTQTASSSASETGTSTSAGTRTASASAFETGTATSTSTSTRTQTAAATVPSSLASKTGTPTSAGTRTASASAFETGTATSTSTSTRTQTAAATVPIAVGSSLGGLLLIAGCATVLFRWRQMRTRDAKALGSSTADVDGEHYDSFHVNNPTFKRQLEAR